MYSKKELARLRKSLKAIEKCNGDCRNCEKLEFKTASLDPRHTVYAWLCTADPDIQPYSNTIKGLRTEMLDALQFELS